MTHHAQNAPEQPVRTTSHPAGYPYSGSLSDLRRYRAFEGGAWYTGEMEGRYVAVADEGTLVDFLDDPSDLIRIYEFESRQARDAWIAWRVPSGRTS